MIDLSLAEFSARAAAREPTPGGGSVAAYVGSLGAALGAMAARFSEGRKELAQHSAELADEIDRLEALRGELLDLVNRDAEAYARVSAATALPRGTDDEKRSRGQALQAALREAMEPPLAVCRLAIAGLELLDSLRGHVNRHLASDVAVGAYALAAAQRSAWINVLINLGSLKDAALRERVLAEGRDLGQRATALERAIGPAIEASLL